MNNKKGFTLIELLAVILILGIIALIAIPVVTDILKEARKMAFKNSVVGVYRAIENNNGKKGFQNNEEYIYSNNELQYIISNGVNLENPEIIDIKGNIENGYGIGKVDGDGKITLAIQNGTYCAYNENGDLKFNVIEGDCGNLVTSSLWTDSSCFTFDEPTKTITGYDSNCGTSIVIPPTINGVNVEHIGEWAFVDIKNDFIAWILNTYSDSYNEYPLKYADAIAGGYEIISLDPVRLSGQETIACQKNGSYSYIPLGTKMEDAQCEWSYLNDDDTEYGGGYLENVDLSYLENLKTIDRGAFYHNEISNLKMGNLSNLKEIGPSAFAHNNINDIYLENLNNLETISSFAFYYNGENGKNILNNLPKLKTIGDYSFYYNYAEFKLNDLPSLEYIGRDAFSFLLYHDGELDLSNTKLKYIGEEAFYYAGIPSLKLPSTMEYIGKAAFNDSYIGGTLDLSNLVNVNNQMNYLYFNEFENIVLPPVANLELKEDAIGSNNLTTLVIPSNVTVIDKDSLHRYNLQGLTKIVNLTGKAFDWGLAFGDDTSNIFETGTYTDDYGTIEIVNSQ